MLGVSALAAILGGRSLDGRVVVLTGATAGIGRATALRLADRGATVVAVARTAADVEELAARSDRIFGHPCDVARDEDRSSLVDATLAQHGRIDVLVNNLGIGWTGLVEDMALDDVRRLVETNVVALVDLTRLVLPHMLARGNGDILLTASGASWFATPPLTVYSATKYAVLGFAEGLRREVGTRGVSVHTVHPGFVSTQFAARSVGTPPGDLDGVPLPGPGFSPDWVAAAIEHALTRPAHNTVAVPRVLGAAVRVVKLPPLKQAVDLVLGANAVRIGRLGRRVAEERAGRRPTAHLAHGKEARVGRPNAAG